MTVAHFLTADQQKSLRDLGGPSGRLGLYATIEDLDAMIQMIKAENPYAFHDPDSLEKRVFFNQPLGPVPYAGFKVAAPRDSVLGSLTAPKVSKPRGRSNA
jgi:hypothetical protein